MYSKESLLVLHKSCFHVEMHMTGLLVFSTTSHVKIATSSPVNLPLGVLVVCMLIVRVKTIAQQSLDQLKQQTQKC